MTRGYGDTIVNNTDWGRYGGELSITEFQTGPTVMHVKFDWRPVMLVDGADNQLIGIIVQDDLTGLVSHTAFITGVNIDR